MRPQPSKRHRQIALLGALAIAGAVVLPIVRPEMFEWERNAALALFVVGIGLLLLPLYLQGTAEETQRRDWPYPLATLILIPIAVILGGRFHPDLYWATFLLIYPLGRSILFAKGWLRRRHFDHV